MKHLNLGTIIIVALIGFYAFSNTPAKQEENNDTGQIGNVIFSVLAPVQFEEENGEGWELLYGGTFSSSVLADRYQIATVPDARGRFIRVIDNSQGTNRRDIDRKIEDPIGTPQDQAVKIPDLNTRKDGRHRHHMGYGVRSDQAFNNRPETVGGLAQSIGPRTDAWLYHTSKGESEHSHTISGVGAETRPVNITLYAYIKVR